MAFDYVRSWLEILQIAFMLEKIRVEGAENIPIKGPFILISNSLSRLDPLLIMMSIQRPFLGLFPKSILNKSGIISFSCRRAGAFGCGFRGLGQRARSMALKTLNQEYGICYIPERQGENFYISPDIIALSAQTGAPILPLNIQGTDKAYPDHVFFPRPKEMILRVGSRLYLPHGEELSVKEVNIIRDQIHDLILALGQ